MSQHPLFDVSPEQVAALDDEGLRLLIARLCEADLRRRGLPVGAVLYGGNQIAADGGIDVRVELPADTDIFGFIPRPATGFQAKADDMPVGEIEREMRPKAKQADGTKAGRLRPSIRALAEAGGAYVIVSSKGSTTDSRLTERRDAMRTAVADLRCADDQLLRAAEALALVYSFDGEAFTGDGAEVLFIAGLAGLEWREVLRAVGELKRRDIVQSRGRWRAILPQPLANWLAKRALQNLSPLEVADAFWGCANPRILKSFTHRLSYLHDAPEAQQIGTVWLRPGGPLSDLRAMTWSSMDQRIDLVRHLAPVVPNAILDLIKRFVLDSEPDQLKTRECPKRQPLRSLLRKLAWFPGHFRRAALLLSRFVQSELTEGDRKPCRRLRLAAEDRYRLPGLVRWCPGNREAAGPVGIATARGGATRHRGSLPRPLVFRARVRSTGENRRQHRYSGTLAGGLARGTDNP